MENINIFSMIIYEDNEILAVNKPPGFLSIQDGYHPDLPNLKRILDSRFGKVWTVHRLDKETSGIIIFSKNASSHRFLNQQFSNRKIKKTYHAFLNGYPPSEFTINMPLKINGDRKHRTIVDYNKGHEALTEVKIIQYFNNYCFAEIYPHTGYTHQIRAHLFAMGFSLIGDTLYVSRSDAHKFPILRTALHAFSISFLHPINKEMMTLTAPYPEDFSNLFIYLQNKKADC